MSSSALLLTRRGSSRRGPEESDAGRGQAYRWLALVTVGLVGFGLVMVYSASSGFAQIQFESGHFFLKRWAIRAGISLVALILVSQLDYRFWGRKSRLLLVVSFAGLGAVLALKLFGVGNVRGAYRWIQFPGGSFQPSALMQLALVVFLADVLSRSQTLVTDRLFFQRLMGTVGAALALIVLQPDLGTALAIGLTCAVVMYLAGVRLLHLMATGGIGAVLVTVVVFGIGYRKERVLTYLNPGDDVHGAGYQSTQSLLALGSGGATGVGLGQSMQKYFFLPEPHTDFVFSILGEELGLLGAGGLVILFVVFGRLGFKIARQSPDLFGFLLASGITCTVLVYAFVNIGVCVGALPTTGLPLPFISYGGSSLLLTMVATGILLNIGRQAAANPGSLPRQHRAPSLPSSGQTIYRGHRHAHNTSIRSPGLG